MAFALCASSSPATGNAMRPGACRFALIKKTAPVQGVDGLQHGSSKLVCHPTAFSHAVFDRIDPAVALSRIVVSGTTASGLTPSKRFFSADRESSIPVW